MRGQSDRNRCKVGEWAAGASKYLFLDTKTQFRWPPAFHARTGFLECPPKPELFRPSLDQMTACTSIP